MEGNEALLDFDHQKLLSRLDDMTIVACRAAEPLAQRIQHALVALVRREFSSASVPNMSILEAIIERQLALLPRHTKHHWDGEPFVKLQQTVRQKDVYTVQAFPDPDADSMELYVMCDALLRAGASSITTVVPYVPFNRQDKKDDGRVPISAKLWFNLLKASCGDGGRLLNRIVTFDFHARQAQAFWDGPVDELSAIPLFAAFYRRELGHLYDGRPVTDCIGIVSPDAGGAKRANYLSKLLGCRYYVLAKERTGHGEVSDERYYIDWDCSGKVAVLVDDLFDTAKTIVNAARFLQSRGATVYICGTHAVLSRHFDKDVNEWVEAYDRLKNADVHILTTDSLPEKFDGFLAKNTWLTAIGLAEDLAYVMYASQTGLSVSKYLGEREEHITNGLILPGVSEHPHGHSRIIVPDKTTIS